MKVSGSRIDGACISSTVLFFRVSITFLFLIAFCVSIQASTIEGIVYDQSTNPLVEVDVELRNENGQTRQRRRTDTIGRYSFTNLADGRYYVKVFAFRYNLVDAEKMIRLDSLSILGGTGNHTYRLDFHLARKRGGLADTTTGVVFAQAVPKDARKYYKEAIKLLGKDERDEGFRKLIKAVETFPTYYEALKRLGMHLLYKQRFMDAASMFVRAAEVNPKSSKSFYYMGIAFSRLGRDYYKAALAALGKAEFLAPKAHQIPFEIGKLHKKLNNYEEAELKLIRAKKLAPKKIPEIHLQLAQLYADNMKQYGKAADELEAYIKASKSKDSKLKAKVADLRAKARKRT